jgi:hypothetical protein
MKRFYGLALVCLVSAFAIGCDSSVEDEVSEGVAPPAEIQQQQSAYDNYAKSQKPNAQGVK